MFVKTFALVATMTLCSIGRCETTLADIKADKKVQAAMANYRKCLEVNINFLRNVTSVPPSLAILEAQEECNFSRYPGPSIGEAIYDFLLPWFITNPSPALRENLLTQSGRVSPVLRKEVADAVRTDFVNYRKAQTSFPPNDSITLANRLQRVVAKIKFNFVSSSGSIQGARRCGFAADLLERASTSVKQRWYDEKLWIDLELDYVLLEKAGQTRGDVDFDEAVKKNSKESYCQRELREINHSASMSEPFVGD